MRLVVLGAPGAGKATQAHLMVEKYGMVRIAVGDLLRQEQATNSPLGLQIKTALEQANSVPDDVLIGLIRQRISRADTTKGFVLEGFPETIEQAQLLTQSLQMAARPLQLVILLDTDFDALMQRITGRRACRSCGQVYNIYTEPPKLDDQCDECGGNLRHRADDNEEIISNRYRLFEAQINPVIEYFQTQGLLRRVQGIGDINDIFTAIGHMLDELEHNPDELAMPTMEALEQMVLDKAQEAQAEEASKQGQNKSVSKKDKGAKKAKASTTPKKASTKSVSRAAVSNSTKAKKKTAPKKAAIKKASAKKKVSKKSNGKKVASKKVASKKVASKKNAAAKKKTTAKKASAKKTVAKKKTTAKKASAKKTVAKKVVAKKKTTSKKQAAKKKPVKKAGAKKVKAKKTAAKKTTKKKRK